MATRRGRTKQTRCVVLRRFDWSETSRIVHLVSPDLGLLKILARGVHRPTSPWRGMFDHWNLLDLRVRHRPSDEYQQLDHAHLVDHHPHLKRELACWFAVNYATELVSAVVQPGVPCAELFEHYVAFQRHLGLHAGLRRHLLLAFELGLLDSLGLRPAFLACASCGAELKESKKPRRIALFSAELGGIACSNCRRQINANRDRTTFVWRRVALPCLEWGERLLEEGPKCPETPMPDRCAESLRRVVDGFLVYHLEHEPRARAFLRF